LILILLKSSFLFLVYRHGNRDEMISYFLHHHVPPKNRTYILVETGRAPSHPLKMVFKITVRRWETGHAPSLQLGDNHFPTFYATSQVA